MVGALAARTAIHAVADGVDRGDAVRQALLDLLEQLALVAAERVGGGRREQEDDLLLLPEHVPDDVREAELLDHHVGVLASVKVVVHHLGLDGVPLVDEDFATKALQERCYEFYL